MDGKVFDLYSMVTQNSIPRKYNGPEEQSKAIKRCTILKSVEIKYSNSSSYASIEDKRKPQK